MGSLATTAFILFLILMAVGAGAFVVAWSAARLASARYQRDLEHGRSRPSWGGRDYDRVRTKYFDKERRARAARDRTRTAFPPPPRSESAGPSTSDIEHFHRETLGLVGVELTARILREAYKQRVREYHPDRVAALGIKLRLLAEEETKRINDAYKYLQKLYSEDPVGQDWH